MEKLGMTRDPADDFDHPGISDRQPIAAPRLVPNFRSPAIEPLAMIENL